MSKKIIPLMLCILLIFVICACSSKTDTDTTQDTQFSEITDYKTVSNDIVHIKVKLVYDNETKSVYYVGGGGKSLSLSPYIRNGHFTYYDTEAKEIKEFTNE